jgi:hypothetical protein
MIAALLVCSLSTSVPQCSQDEAIAVFFGPSEYNQLYQCMFEGQAYAAESGLVTKGTYLKVVCGERAKILARFGKRPVTHAKIPSLNPY